MSQTAVYQPIMYICTTAPYFSLLLFYLLLLRPGRGAEHCDQPICLCVCLSVCPRAYLWKRWSNRYEILCADFCGRGSVLLRRRCATLCTSGFMDDVTFGRNGRDTERWRLHSATAINDVAIPGRSLMSMNACCIFYYLLISFLQFFVIRFNQNTTQQCMLPRSHRASNQSVNLSNSVWPYNNVLM